jgi:predicted outer membrane repeat protein
MDSDASVSVFIIMSYVSLSTTALLDGGAIFSSQKNGKLTITGTTFKGNQATGQGGAVYFSTISNATWSNNTYVNNTALRGGKCCITLVCVCMHMLCFLQLTLHSVLSSVILVSYTL